jgi:hypothetical protein
VAVERAQGVGMAPPSFPVDSGSLPIERLAHRIAGLRDGRHVWGSLTVYRTRDGRRVNRLEVQPPGLSATTRRLLRLWSALPRLAFLALMIALVVGHLIGTVLGGVVIVGGVVLIGMLFLTAAVPERTRVRRLWAPDLETAETDADRRAATTLLRLAGQLTSAERLLSAGRIEPAALERVWRDVYAELTYHS